MHPAKFRQVSAMPVEERYDYLVAKASEYETLWSLQRGGLPLCPAENGGMAMPFWPEEEFAEACAVGEWEGMTPVPIPLADFLEDWVTGMLRDKLLVAAFPTTAENGRFVRPAEFGVALKKGMHRFM